MNNQEFLIKKIPLERFLYMLTETYNGGAIFIDIVGSCNSEDHQDTLRIVVHDNYFETATSDSTPSVFHEEDIDQLI